jgi:trans-aconitate methyltransferase
MTEWNASDYHRQSTLQETLAAASLAAVHLDGGERVLDVGCGDGKTTAAIAARVPRGSVLGVDPSRRMIDFAGEHFRAPEHPNLRFAVGDARSLAFQEEFDLVVSFYALHWVPEQEAALRGIRAALKPAGTTLLQFVGESERPSIEDVIEATRQSPRWAGYFPADFRKPYAHFTPAEYRVMAERNGLRVVRLGMGDQAWDFKTRAGFVAFCHATFVIWAQHLPEAERDAFITDVLDRYRAVAETNPSEANTFKFYQLEVVLTPELPAGG